MSTTQRLDTASGVFFFSGFMLAKLQYIPVSLVATAFRFLSLAMYLAAYSLWFASTLLKPSQEEQKDKWYGFAKIKEQFLLSSFIGFTATVLSIAAIFVPVLFPIAAWLFLLGNTVWAIGEYHKLKNPPVDDENFSYSRQKSYMSYAAVTSSMSLVTALAATLMLVFPPLTVPITLFSLLITIGLGVLAFEYWLDFNFGNHQPAPKSNSYCEMEESLGSSISHDNDLSPAPQHTKGLFSTLSSPQAKIKLTPLSSINEDSFPTPSLL